MEHVSSISCYFPEKQLRLLITSYFDRNILTRKKRDRFVWKHCLFIPHQCFTYFKQAAINFWLHFQYFLSISWSCFLGFYFWIAKNKAHGFQSVRMNTQNQNTQLSVDKKEKNIFWWKNLPWCSHVRRSFKVCINCRVDGPEFKIQNLECLIWFLDISDKDGSIFILHFVLLRINFWTYPHIFCSRRQVSNFVTSS